MTGSASTAFRIPEVPLASVAQVMIPSRARISFQA
jgi:hypothetical protein